MIMGILVTKDLIRPVSILVARVLPDSTNQNAMKNLYAYDSINRILYLKQSLLNTTPGAVSVAIQHACAHIKAGDLRSDNHPAFRAEFFNFLASIATFLFKVRSHASIQIPVAFTNTNSEMDMTMTQYKDAFDPRMSPENVSERLETVNYQIALAIRAGLPVVELQKEQKELQLKVRKR